MELRSPSGQTPLHVARNTGHVHCTLYLWCMGAHFRVCGSDHVRVLVLLISAFAQFAHRVPGADFNREPGGFVAGSDQ